MYFREVPAFEETLKKATSASFLEGVCRKYHYLPENLAELEAVAKEVEAAARQEASYEYSVSGKGEAALASVIMTLGAAVDELQEAYQQKDFLTEVYMIEAIANELLLMSYKAFNSRVAEETPYVVARYHFLGSEPEYDIERLPELLLQFQVPVTCNQAYCMEPKKSVVFYARLTQDKTVQCQGICTGCGRKDCPNRTGDEKTEIRSWIDFINAGGTQILPYGYARIFGKGSR